jgi:hypothetical protein
MAVILGQRSYLMKELKPGDVVAGMTEDGSGVEVYKLVKVWNDRVQAADTSGNLSRATLRAYDEHVVQQMMQRSNQIKALRQEIRNLFDGLKRVD